MNTITIITIIIVALVSIAALIHQIKKALERKAMKSIDLDPKEFYQVYVGTTKMNGKTIHVAEGRYEDVWQALRYFKRNNPGTSGWNVHPARSPRT